jgi:hypothetical protein
MCAPARRDGTSAVRGASDEVMISFLFFLASFFASWVVLFFFSSFKILCGVLLFFASLRSSVSARNYYYLRFLVMLVPLVLRGNPCKAMLFSHLVGWVVRCVL